MAKLADDTAERVKDEPDVADAPRSVTLSIGRLRSIAALVVGVLVLAALAYWGTDRYLAIHRADGRDADRRGALVAARNEVVALTTISAATSTADIKRLLAGAAPGFRAEFEKQATDFTNAVKQANVTSKGSIASAGVQSLGGDKAVVLVAATGTVTNVNNKQAEPRNYRLRVSLERSGDRWLVSGMDFVA